MKRKEAMGLGLACINYFSHCCSKMSGKGREEGAVSLFSQLKTQSVIAGEAIGA